MDWSTLLSTFGLVLVAELGDKTQLAVVAQTCKYHRPLAVFLGASLGLTAATALGVVGGQALGRIVPEPVLRGVAVLAFVVMGVLVWLEAVRAGGGPSAAAEGQCSEEGPVERASNAARHWKAFSSTLGLLFIAELGDKTQLAVLGLAGKNERPWLVFLGGTLALTAVTALGVVGGEGLCRLIPERLLLRMSAVAFVAVGLLVGLRIL